MMNKAFQRLFLISMLGQALVCWAAQSESVQPKTETPPATQPLGRLFFSPDERAMLDQMRQKSAGRSFSSTNKINLGGYVKRSSGHNTTWINQQPLHDGESPQGITIRKPSHAAEGMPLQLPSGKQIILKPGQTYDTAKGKVREGYEDPSAATGK